MQQATEFTLPCPNCGYDPRVDQCEVSGCHEPAEWEGWWRVIDGMGIPTGLIQRRRVCEEHKKMLIGYKE